MHYEETFAKTIECESRVLYESNPLKSNAQPQISGPIRSFVELLYPMPDKATNPMIWNYRCDWLWEEFTRLSIITDNNEMVFWATVKVWLPEVRCCRMIFDGSLVREVPRPNGVKEKHLWHWKEHTFELRGIGYNSRPKNPWLDISKTSSEPDDLPR